MPSLKLSNPFRRADGRPSLKERGAALKAAAARVIRRPRPTEIDLEVDWSSAPPGFMAYPASEPQGFSRILSVLPREIQRLHAIAEAEFKRRCEACLSLSESQQAAFREDFRHRLRLDALKRAAYPEANVPPALLGAIIGGDEELLDLGQQFRASFEREMEAYILANACQAKANELLPDRPDSLYFRASDEAFGLHNEGRGFQDDRAIRQIDIAWMTRRPCQREVWRDAGDGERGWDMAPGKVPEMQPWPEAQARVDEIVAAWETYHAEFRRIQTEAGAEEASEVADRIAEQSEAIASEIAKLPASTAEGMRVKLRVLHCYAPLGAREDLEDPETPLMRSLFRDAGL